MEIQTGVLYNKDEAPIGFWFTVDRQVKWDVPDPPELLKIARWIAANESSFEKSYRTTRQDCGFAVVFASCRDADQMYDFLLEPGPVSDTADVMARLHRRRNKYQQLPGNGDRKWSARMDRSVLKKLRTRAMSPFSYDRNGALYLPVTQLRSFQLNR